MGRTRGKSNQSQGARLQSVVKLVNKTPEKASKAAKRTRPLLAAESSLPTRSKQKKNIEKLDSPDNQLHGEIAQIAQGHKNSQNEQLASNIMVSVDANDMKILGWMKVKKLSIVETIQKKI